MSLCDIEAGVDGIEVENARTTGTKYEGTAAVEAVGADLGIVVDVVGALVFSDGSWDLCFGPRTYSYCGFSSHDFFCLVVRQVLKSLLHYCQ